jgi:hypothetical protein
MCDASRVLDPFNFLRHGKKRGQRLDPEIAAELEAEMEANQQTAMRRRRRQSNSLFGAGSSVLGSPAKTASSGATAMGRGTSGYTGGRDSSGLR